MKMVKFAAIMAGLLLVTQVFADEQKFENLNQYFEYLPNAVHKNWTPYKANSDYEVLNAVKAGAPYRPLPEKFPGESVNTQIELKFIK